MINQVKPLWLVWAGAVATVAAIGLFYVGSYAGMFVGGGAFAASLMLLVKRDALTGWRGQVRFLRWLLGGLPLWASLGWAILIVSVLWTFVDFWSHDGMRVFGVMGIYFAYSGLGIAWATVRVGPFAANAATAQTADEAR